MVEQEKLESREESKSRLSLRWGLAARAVLAALRAQLTADAPRESGGPQFFLVNKTPVR